MRSGAILHKQIIEGQPSIAWAEINGLAHVPVAATEAKLVRLPRLIAPMRAGKSHYAAWPMFELWAIMISGRIPRRSLCANRVSVR